MATTDLTKSISTVAPSVGGVEYPQATPSVMSGLDALEKEGLAAEPIVLSTENAANDIAKKQTTLASLTPPTPPPTTKTETAVKPEEMFVTMINPATGQEMTFYNPSLNMQRINDLASIGWSVGEAKINEPLNLPTGGASDTAATTDKTAELNDKIKTAKDTYETAKGSLSQETQLIISSIEAQYQNLIDQMNVVNRSRQKNLETIGMRMGSRYVQGGEATAKLVAEEAVQGATRIAGLVASRNSLIAQAKESERNREWTEFTDTMNRLEKEQDKIDTELSAQAKAAAEAQKKIKEQQRQSSVEGAIAGLISQGVSDPVDLINLLNYDEQGNLIGDVTTDEIKKAMDVFLPKGKDMSTLGVDARMYEWSKQQGWLPEGASFFDYLRMESEAKRDPKAQKAGMGAALDFGQFKRESVAMSVLPPTLRNSDAEKEYYLSGIRQGLAEGKSPYEIADTLMGYNITAPSAFSEGMRKFVSLIGGTDRNMAPELARLINAGAYDKAIAVVENEIYGKIQKIEGDQYVSEADVIYVSDKVQEIKDLLGEGWSDAIGPFEGTFNDAIKRFRTKDYQKIKTKVNSITADLINKRAGSALTDTEWNRLVADSVPSMVDKAGIFMDKLSELEGNPLTRLNAERTSFELPPIDKNMLRDRTLRVLSYQSSLAKDEADAEQTLIDYGANNPSKQSQITAMLSDGMSPLDIAQALNIPIIF